MIKILAAIAILWGLVGTACTSGAMEKGTVSIWGGDVTVPKVVSLEIVSGTELNAAFTAPISVSRANVVLSDTPDEVIPVTWEIGADANSIRFFLADGIGIGINAALSASVTDARGNTLSFSMPFTGFNNRVPRLRINEIRTEYSKPKVEYIELYVVEGGNLGGVEIYNAMNTVKSTFEFPASEVAPGDYIVYHLRSVEVGLVDETGPVDVSAGIDARPGARDFWDNLTSSPLKKTNVILVRERKGGAILDALLCAETGKTEWPNDTVRLAAEEAFAAGAWLPGPLVVDAVISTGTTVTRSIGRNEVSGDTGTAKDWKISATSKCSPGATNVPH